MKKRSVLFSSLLMILLLVPIIASATSNFTVTDLIVTQDSTNYKMSIGTYGNLVDTGGDKKLRVGFVTSSNGSTYTIEQYSQALDFSQGNVSSTLEKLNASGKPVTVTTEPAEFDSNGNLITGVNKVFEVTSIE